MLPHVWTSTIIQSERCQTQKDMSCAISLLWSVLKWFVGNKGNGKWLPIGKKFSSGGVMNILELDSDSQHVLWMLKATK